jgi:hypothetical protein
MVGPNPPPGPSKIVRPKTKAGQRALEKRAPKLVRLRPWR